jgi:hypothetical protein
MRGLTMFEDVSPIPCDAGTWNPVKRTSDEMAIARRHPKLWPNVTLRRH